jgi:hypothetical protein
MSLTQLYINAERNDPHVAGLYETI